MWTEMHTNLAIALGTLILGYAGWFVQRRAQKTTEKSEARQKDEGAYQRMRDIAAIIQAERDRTDEKLDHANGRIESLELERNQTREEMAALRSEFRDVQTTLRTAISYIRDLLAAWAQMIATPPPPIPDALSHHVAHRNVTDLFDTQDPK